MMILCSYGCGKEAKYQFKNGKWCCEYRWEKCLASRERQSMRVKNIWRNPDYRKLQITLHRGKKYSEEHNRKISQKLKGKTYEELYGEEKAEELKKSQSERMMGHKHPCQSREVSRRNKRSRGMKVHTSEEKEKRRQRLKNGQAVYMNSFIKNPSRPQVKIFENAKDLYQDSILNYQLGKYSLDIGIVSIKLDIEHDGSHWHNDLEKDKKRDQDLKSLGWKILRYRDYIPTKEQLLEDIRKVEGENHDE